MLQKIRDTRSFPIRETHFKNRQVFKRSVQNGGGLNALEHVSSETAPLEDRSDVLYFQGTTTVWAGRLSLDTGGIAGSSRLLPGSPIGPGCPAGEVLTS